MRVRVRRSIEFSPELYEKIEAEAKANGMSVNQFITRILEEAVKEAGKDGEETRE